MSLRIQLRDVGFGDLCPDNVKVLIVVDVLEDAVHVLV